MQLTRYAVPMPGAALSELRCSVARLELYPVIISLLQWGDRHLAEDGGRPLKVLLKDCGSHPLARVVCAECGEQVDPRGCEPVYPGGGAATGSK